MHCFTSILFTLILLFNTTFSLILPFKKSYPCTLTSIHFPYLYTNYLGVELCIGTPPQCLIFNLDQSAYPIWVIDTSSSMKKANQTGFDKDKSTSISFKDEFKQSYNYDKYENAYSALDTLSLSKNYPSIPKINDVFFLLVDIFTDVEVNDGVIGLDIQHKIYKNTLGSNFIEQLKKKDIVSSYQYAIHYSSDDSGLLVIGESIKELDATMDLIKYKVISSGVALRWGIELDRIQSGSAFIQRDQKAAFKVEIGFIIGSELYGEYLYNSFFKRYLDIAKCSYTMFLSNFFGYSCDNTISEIDTSAFEPLIFKIKNRVYELTAKDLFKTFGDESYFMVIFPKKSFYYVNVDWVIGEPFYRKFTLTFDQDKKQIGIYTPKTGQNSSDDKNYGLCAIVFIIGVIFGLIALMGAYVVYRKCNMRRAKRLDYSNEM